MSDPYCIRAQEWPASKTLNKRPAKNFNAAELFCEALF